MKYRFTGIAALASPACISRAGGADVLRLQPRSALEARGPEDHERHGSGALPAKTTFRRSASRPWRWLSTWRADHCARTRAFSWSCATVRKELTRPLQDPVVPGRSATSPMGARGEAGC